MSARRIALVTALALLTAAPASAAQPQTGFEQRAGASWTTHEEELGFLAAVDAASARVAVEQIGTTLQGRPLQLVRIGDPAPRTTEEVRAEPSLLLVCSQHGNEPAGREACLKLVRDLAFTDDPALVELLQAASILVVPSANPDGRAANSRENSERVDMNRDHLNLRTAEARAIAAVVRDHGPDMSIDLHEYGPSLPVLYDDDALYLWPRNLNVDPQVHDMAVELGTHLHDESERRGYTADEYGLYEVADQDIHQSAGDGDEGIMRNTMGLRHSLGILVETAVSASPRSVMRGLDAAAELHDNAALQRRRVDTHMAIAHAALDWLGDNGSEAAAVTAGASQRAAGHGAARDTPVYFGGADNQEPAPEDVVFPPPCGYRVPPFQNNFTLNRTFDLHGIARTTGTEGFAVVPMAQPAEPLIPLLLDARGTRRSVSATPLDAC